MEDPYLVSLARSELPVCCLLMTEDRHCHGHIKHQPAMLANNRCPALSNYNLPSL